MCRVGATHRKGRRVESTARSGGLHPPYNQAMIPACGIDPTILPGTVCDGVILTPKTQPGFDLLRPGRNP